MPKYTAIYARADKATLAALARVARSLRRTESDTIRFLVNTADEKIRAEIKKASIDRPDEVTVSLTTAGEKALQ